MELKCSHMVAAKLREEKACADNDIKRLGGEVELLSTQLEVGVSRHTANSTLGT